MMIMKRSEEDINESEIDMMRNEMKIQREEDE